MAAFSDNEEKLLNTMFQLKTEIVELKKQLKRKDDEIARLKTLVGGMNIPIAEVAIPITSVNPSAPSLNEYNSDIGESKNSQKDPELVMSAEEKKVIDNALKKMRNGGQIYLDNNQITDAGAIKLAEMLPSSKLTFLNLGGNEITDAGAKKLAEMLPSSKLTKLDLNSNKITDAGAIKLAKMLPSSKLTMGKSAFFLRVVMGKKRGKTSL